MILLHLLPSLLSLLAIIPTMAAAAVVITTVNLERIYALKLYFYLPPYTNTSNNATYSNRSKHNNNYSNNFNCGNNSNRVLHSIFSIRKSKKPKRGTTTKRVEEEEDDDILKLFSPGIHEFDCDALASEEDEKEDDEDKEAGKEEEEKEAKVKELRKEGCKVDGTHENTNIILPVDNDDEVTLDSVDRIVRGDFRKWKSHDDNGAVGGLVGASGTKSSTNAEAVVTTTKGAITPTLRNTATTTSSATAKVSFTSPIATTTSIATRANGDDNGHYYDHEYFYTPNQQPQQEEEKNPFVLYNSPYNNNQLDTLITTTSLVTMTSSPMLDRPSLNDVHVGVGGGGGGGGGGASLSSSLAPVYEGEEDNLEDEEEKRNDENNDNDDENVNIMTDVTKTPPFQTPRQFHYDRLGGGDNNHGSSERRGQGGANDDDDDDDDEFFSPLGQYHVNEEIVMTTPKNQWYPVQQQHHQQQQQPHLENESYTDTIREEWKTNISSLCMNDSAQQQHQEQLPQSPQEVANVTSPQSNHDCNQQHATTVTVATSSPPMGSPKYLEMKAELQQMLVEVTELTPHKKEQEVVMTSPLVTTTDASLNENDGVGGGAAAANDSNNTKAKYDVVVEATKTTTRKSSNNSEKLFTPSPSATSHNSFSYSPSSTTPTPQYSHLHSSSISSLPSDALTVDYVKQCDCLDTLGAILSLLSSDDQDGMGNTSIGGGKTYVRGKKQLRYPSLVRYVEKRMRVIAAASTTALVVDNDAELHQLYQGADNSHSHGRDNEGMDKENTSPEVHHELSCAEDNVAARDDTSLSSQVGRQNVPPPLETISVSKSPKDENHDLVEGNDWANHHHRQITPENLEERSESIMTHETSLDMNLSESLDDESYFWKQDGSGQDEAKVEPGEEEKAEGGEYASLDVVEEQQHVYNAGGATAVAPSAPLEENIDASTQFDNYADLQEKLTTSLAAQDQLTEKVESLVKDHDTIRRELTSKLNHARDQLSQHQINSKIEKEDYSKHVSELVQVNQTLEQEMGSLKERLVAVEQKAMDAANQAEFHLDEAKLVHSKLLIDNDRLSKELHGVRLAREKAAEEVTQLQQLLDEQIVSSGTNDKAATTRMQKGLDAAKFANQALANALAISEKDLSEALHQKDETVRECNSLRKTISELEDKSSWLSSKVNELNKELKSSHAYIDKLYADLQCNRSPSKEMKADFERRELQWMELEHQYTRRNQELESQLTYQQQQGGSKVSMSDYVVAVRECRKYQAEAVEKTQVVTQLQSTVSSLKQHIEQMQRRSLPRNDVGRGKSISSRRNIGKKIHNDNESFMTNDENKVPSSGQIVGPISAAAGKLRGNDQKLRRVSALKAVGGRKGLSEQLRRARKVGVEE